jgi:hypothetical protein
MLTLCNIIVSYLVIMYLWFTDGASRFIYTVDFRVG